MRVFAGWGAVAAMALAMGVVSAVRLGRSMRDPANLAGERVRASVTEDPMPVNKGALALEQSLIKLRTRASLMMIVAHPDDEDGGMLTYESRGHGGAGGDADADAG